MSTHAASSAHSTSKMALPEGGEVSEAYRQRCITAAQRAIDVSTDENDSETQLVDLLCHLRHWADEQVDADFDAALKSADWHYSEERRGGGTPISATDCEGKSRVAERSTPVDARDKREEQIRRAAKRIDPHTAQMSWRFASITDPYGLGEANSPGYESVGRCYFLEDPAGEWDVLDYEVRDLHPEISDEDWEALMRDARKRDSDHDPLPFLHKYGRGE